MSQSRNLPSLPRSQLAGGVLVAVSGGADSAALALWLADQGVRPLHLGWVQHGYRPAALGAERRFLRALAQEVEAPLHELRAAPPSRWEPGDPIPEHEARRRRYELLAQCANSLRLPRIATGHHRDDQWETQILQMLRGGDLRALAGIHSERRFGAVLVWRPLLSTPPEVLHRRLAETGLTAVEDATNHDLRQRRNRVRHRLRPAMTDEHPSAMNDLFRLAPLARRALGTLERRIDQEMKRAAVPTIRHRAMLFRQDQCVRLSPALLHHWIEKAHRKLAPASGDVVLSRAYSDQITMWLRDPQSRGHQHWNGLTIERSGPWLSFHATGEVAAWRITPQISPQSPPGAIWSVARATTDPGESLRWPVPVGAEVRPRRTGDVIQVPGRGARRLQQLFQDQQIPRCERGLWPIVVNREGVAIAAPGLTPPPADGPADHRIVFDGLPRVHERRAGSRHG